MSEIGAGGGVGRKIRDIEIIRDGERVVFKRVEVARGEAGDHGGWGWDRWVVRCLRWSGYWIGRLSLCVG